MVMDYVIGSELGRRTATDIVIATTVVGTSPWWQSIDISDVGRGFLLWGSVFMLALRYWGLGKDIWRGRKIRLNQEDDEL